MSLSENKQFHTFIASLSTQTCKTELISWSLSENLELHSHRDTKEDDSVVIIYSYKEKSYLVIGGMQNLKRASEEKKEYINVKITTEKELSLFLYK